MKLRRIGRDRLNFMPHFVRKQKSALISCRLNFMSPCFHVLRQLKIFNEVSLCICFKVFSLNCYFYQKEELGLQNVIFDHHIIDSRNRIQYENVINLSYKDSKITCLQKSCLRSICNRKHGTKYVSLHQNTKLLHNYG